MHTGIRDEFKKNLSGISLPHCHIEFLVEAILIQGIQTSANGNC
jgi:H+/gluconate symporter-like permease